MHMLQMVLEVLARVVNRIAICAQEVILDIVLTKLVIIPEVYVALRAVMVRGVVNPMLASSL